MTYDHYVRVVRRLDWNSSPGYPLVYDFPTNRALFQAGLIGQPSETRLRFVWEIVQEHIQARVSDPIRLFVKPEPHVVRKINNKAYRLISSVSVVDQIIDHMLFDHMNDLAVDNWWNNPVKIGWSPIIGGWKVMPTNFISTDKSSWDWTVCMWLIELVFELRSRLCLTRGDKFQLWRELAIFRFERLFVKSTFITSGGSILRALFDGIMKSGSVNTLIDNSLMQLILHVRCSLELDEDPVPIMAMGDDVIMELIPYLDKYIELMNQYCIVKNVSRHTEFAGHSFKRFGKIEPLYRGKHAYNLLHISERVKQETANSYALLYHRSIHRDWVRQLLGSIGCRLPPLYELDVIYDGEV